MKLRKKSKAEEAEKTIVDHLVTYGLTLEDAKGLTGKLEQYKEMSQDNGNSPQSFKEKESRDITIEGQARMDMAKFLLDMDPSDSIEKRIAMSEIPSPALMHLVMSKTLDDLCSIRKNGNNKVTPIEAFISNYTTFMRGLNRKSRKEGLQIFETDSERNKEDQGMFPPSLKG